MYNASYLLCVCVYTYVYYIYILYKTDSRVWKCACLLNFFTVSKFAGDSQEGARLNVGWNGWPNQNCTLKIALHWCQIALSCTRLRALLRVSIAPNGCAPNETGIYLLPASQRVHALNKTSDQQYEAVNSYSPAVIFLEVSCVTPRYAER